MSVARRKLPEYALRHMSRQKASGLSIADYCRENSITPSTFYGWNKRYKKVPLSPQESSSPLSFIEIPLKKRFHSCASPIRVIRTEVAFPSETVQYVCAALKELLSGNSTL